MSCDNYSLLVTLYQSFHSIFTVRHGRSKERGQIKSGLLFDNCKGAVIVQFDCSEYRELISSANSHAMTANVLFAMLIYGISNHEYGIYMSSSPVLILDNKIRRAG